MSIDIAIQEHIGIRVLVEIMEILSIVSRVNIRVQVISVGITEVIVRRS